jgi:hypothetical protein
MIRRGRFGVNEELNEHFGDQHKRFGVGRLFQGVGAGRVQQT